MPIQKNLSAIKDLLQQQKNVLFFSNTSGNSRNTLHKKLNRFGIQVPITSVYSASYLTALYSKKYLKKPYVITAEGTVEELNAQQVNFLLSSIHDHEDASLPLKLDQDVDSIVTTFHLLLLKGRWV